MSIVEEALRINLRFLTEVVEAFGVCPFAFGSRRGGHVERCVILDETAAPQRIAALEANDAVEVALLIFPRLTLDADAFDAFCAPLRSSTRSFASAVFHPQTRFSTEAPERLVGFFRRAPDPTLQLVRHSVLESVRGERAGGKFVFDFSAAGWAELERRQAELPLSERIARDNQTMLLREGLSRLQAIYDDIAADRARAYAGPER